MPSRLNSQLTESEIEVCFHIGASIERPTVDAAMGLTQQRNICLCKSAVMKRSINGAVLISRSRGPNCNRDSRFLVE